MSRKLFAVGSGRSGRCGSGNTAYALSQELCCSSGSIFNRSGMMVLMAGESGPSCESLLTVCVGALVRSLSGMDTAMTSQRAGVTERLQTMLSVMPSYTRVSGFYRLTLPHLSHMCGFSPV